MSRTEQRNLAIFVGVILGLLVGVGVLANYTGILRADSNQEPAKVSCSSGGGACADSATAAAGLTNVAASVEAGETGGCCSVEKAAGCGQQCGDGCGDKTTGCGNPAGCSKEEGCDKAKPSGCCDNPKAEGCCSAEADGNI
ncbi:MAG: hypothetical protein JSW59_20315 [Phycisphaerales bacterium]|nr:MAG: hypothetical protein JSW59_20315 [Phycisphaerales bacterium]